MLICVVKNLPKNYFRIVQLNTHFIAQKVKYKSLGGVNKVFYLTIM